jgi:hypothetical protein
MNKTKRSARIRGNRALTAAACVILLAGCTMGANGLEGSEDLGQTLVDFAFDFARAMFAALIL